MTRLRFVASLVATAALASAQPPEPTHPPAFGPPARRLDAAQATEDVALLERALRMVHPGLHRYAAAAEIDAAFAALEKAARQPLDEKYLYLEVSQLLARIRCDHTKAELPSAIEKWRRENPSHLPFRFRLFDRRMFVVSTDPAQPPLPRGTEVLAIDGRPVEDVLARIEPLVSVDGFTDGVRATKLEADSDLMGSDLDHFLPLAFGFQPEVALRVGAADQPRDVVMKRIDFVSWKALPWPGAPDRAEFHLATRVRDLDARTALLSVDTFVNYRHPVDPADVYGPIFRGLRERGIETLLVDLRQNGGGSDEPGFELLRRLLARPFTFQKPSWLKAVRYGDLPRYIETWGDAKAIFEPPLASFRALPDGWFEEAEGLPPEKSSATPAAEAFRGRVLVLAGPRNASGSTMVIAKLQDEGRATVVGEPTGGSASGPTAGRIFNLTLPHSGIIVRIPVKRVRVDLAHAQEGQGVMPDRVVRPTLQDFLADRDPVLDAARALAR